jgi:hypothetical protein
VVLSGYGALFKIDPSRAGLQIAMTVLVFAVGLVASWVCSFYAYRAAKLAMQVANFRISGTILRILGEEKEESAKTKGQYDAAAKLLKQELGATKVAIGTGIFSLAAFVAGALIGGWMLMTHAGA